MSQAGEDAEVEAAMRPFVDAYYRAMLAAGHSEDDALRLAGEEQKKLRAEWVEAKRKDGVCSQE